MIPFDLSKCPACKSSQDTVGSLKCPACSILTSSADLLCPGCGSITVSTAAASISETSESTEKSNGITRYNVLVFVAVGLALLFQLCLIVDYLV